MRRGYLLPMFVCAGTLLASTLAGSVGFAFMLVAAVGGSCGYTHTRDASSSDHRALTTFGDLGFAGVFDALVAVAALVAGFLLLTRQSPREGAAQSSADRAIVFIKICLSILLGEAVAFFAWTLLLGGVFPDPLAFLKLLFTVVLIAIALAAVSEPGRVDRRSAVVSCWLALAVACIWPWLGRRLPWSAALVLLPVPLVLLHKTTAGPGSRPSSIGLGADKYSET